MNNKKFFPIYHPIFIRRLIRNLIFGAIIIVISQFLGMLGYHYLEDLSWIDAYENAAMILSGMGPVATLHTSAGKIFAGTYALFSGVVFLVVVGVTFAPVVHWFFHKFHMKEN